MQEDSLHVLIVMMVVTVTLIPMIMIVRMPVAMMRMSKSS